jgi:hypothetical protein
MKTPRELADAMKIRKAGEVVRETLRMPSAEARKRVKRLFEEYPSAAYLTEIESWRELGRGGVVEFTMKRLDSPIDDTD